MCDDNLCLLLFFLFQLNISNLFKFSFHATSNIDARLPDDIQQRIYFQQDGCAPHNTRIVHNYLNLKFGEHWLGTYGPVARPSRSPNLLPLDFFSMELSAVNSLCCSNTKYGTVKAANSYSMRRSSLRQYRKGNQYKLTMVERNCTHNKMDFDSKICCDFFTKSFPFNYSTFLN